MAREALIPGCGYFNETNSDEAQTPGHCFLNQTISSSGSSVKTKKGVAIASVKSIKSVAIASVKTIKGLA